MSLSKGFDALGFNSIAAQSWTGRGSAGVPTRVRWTIVALAAFVTGLTYVDRLNLESSPKIFRKNSISRAVDGLDPWRLQPGLRLVSSARRLAGRPLRFAPGTDGAILWFSFFTALTTVAPRLPILNLLSAAWAFAIVRFLMGLGESAAFPVGNKMMGYWLGPKERALGTSIFLSGVGVAGVIAPVLITRMASDFGWRSPFLVFGVIGILAALACTPT